MKITAKQLRRIIREEYQNVTRLTEAKPTQAELVKGLKGDALDAYKEASRVLKSSKSAKASSVWGMLEGELDNFVWAAHQQSGGGVMNKSQRGIMHILKNNPEDGANKALLAAVPQRLKVLKTLIQRGPEKA